MKSRKPLEKLVTILVRNFIAYSFALGILVAAVSQLRENYIHADILDPNIHSFIMDEKISTRDFKSINVDKYFRKDGSFLVVNEQGEIIYRSSKDLPKRISKEEVESIPEYNNTAFIDTYQYLVNGNKRNLVIKTEYKEDYGPLSEVLLLDENFRPIKGTLSKDIPTFERKEALFLAADWSKDYELYRHEVEDDEGELLTIIIRLPIPTAKLFNEIEYQSNFIWLLLIPFYILITVLFIYRLKRRIGKPLLKLKDAIETLESGETAVASEVGGAREFYELGKSFDEMTMKLNAMEEEKKRLVTDISHDLKTPITVIYGYTNAIISGKIKGEEVEDYLHLINRKAEALNELILKVHEYTKLEHPDFKMELEETDLYLFLQNYLAEKYHEIELAGGFLEVDLKEGKGKVLLDPRRITRVFDNLIANAIKHNVGKVTILVELSYEKHCAIVDIKDDGVGIDKDLREYIFTPFTMGDISRSKGGSGLGLTIAHRIMTEHQGTMTLMKAVKGTYFRLCFPYYE